MARRLACWSGPGPHLLMSPDDAGTRTRRDAFDERARSQAEASRARRLAAAERRRGLARTERDRIDGLPGGEAGRWIALAGMLAGGLVLAIVLIPQFAPWTAPGAFPHHH